MSSKEHKRGKDWTRCRCCLSEGAFRSLYVPYLNADEEELYSEMLRECLNIELSPVSELLSLEACSICRACIRRLRAAVSFRRQVVACEEKFRRLYLANTNFCEFNVEIKTEPLENQDQIFKSENNDIEERIVKGEPDEDKIVTSDHLGGIIVTSDHLGGIMVNDDHKFKIDNDDTNISDGNEDFNFDDEDEPLIKTAIKKSSRIKLRAVKSQTKTKKKPARKKATAPVTEAPENDTNNPSEAIAGDNKTLKRPLLRLQADVDYRRVGDSLQCCRCEKQSKSLNLLRCHIKTVHLKLPKHACPHCDKMFLTVTPLTIHKLEEHNIDDRIKCNACNNTFNTKVQLRKHINSFHMLGSKYKCDLCDYESFSVESLYKHKFKHKTVKDYHCMFCKKSFLRKTTLQLHERIHTGDRRKVCKVCGQAFVQKASLNYHMTKYHPEVAF